MNQRISQRIADNVASVRQRIGAAAGYSGRSTDEITLVSVTKYVDAAIARLLVDAGCRDLGESRPQVLWEKAAELTDLDIRWHLVGSLQRNKVARTLPLASLIHSVDSVRLAETISRLAVERRQVQDVLLEVNISDESAKQGFMHSELAETLPRMAELDGLRLCGLMGMAALEAGESETRRQFAGLRQLRESLRTSLDATHPFDHLSMGMSGDFESAIAEGATIVRIGSVLFEGIDR